jgi:hypothetical protein
MPKITALITEFDPSLSFDVQLKRGADSTLHDYVRSSCIEGELNTIINKHDKADSCTRDLSITCSYGSNFVNTVTAVLSSEEPNETKQKKLEILKDIRPESIISETKENSYVLNMQAYCMVEHDPVKRDKFASTQLDKFSETCTGKLDNEEKERIKQVVIDIMKPLCKDKNEEKDLEKNAGKLVRECASQAGITKSWSQAWSKFKDNIGNVVNYIMGKENEVSKIMSRNPEITETLKNAMKSASESANMGHAEKQRPTSRDSSLIR